MKIRKVDIEHVPLDAAKIRALRLKLGLSQAEAARLAGMAGRSHWNRIEKGYTDPTLGTIERIAAALGVRAKDLLK